MTSCLACGRPMSTHDQHGNRPQFCSRPCASRANGNVIRTRNLELDEVAVMRLIAGDPVRSTKAERLEAVRVLTERGQSAAWIAQRLHVTERSVTRHRAELNTRKEIAA